MDIRFPRGGVVIFGLFRQLVPTVNVVVVWREMMQHGID